MNAALLTQTQLMDRLRSEGLPLGHDTIQACIRAKLPGVVWIPGRKKPRFRWEAFWPALIASKELDPMALEVRDDLFRRRTGRRTG